MITRLPIRFKLKLTEWVISVDYYQIGQQIRKYRKACGMSQEQLAEKASISRSHLSAIEAPNMVRAFSMEAFFNIADALDVTPEELIQIAFLQDKILKRK